jgi:hypothetical protein
MNGMTDKQVANLALARAIAEVVADVRNSWPEATPVDAVTYAHETVGVGDLNDDDPTYLAYLVTLSVSTGVARGLARRQQQAEEATRAGELEDGNLVVTKDQRTGRVKGSATLTPSGWVVSVTYDEAFAHLTAGGGADYAVADVTKLG